MSDLSGLPSVDALLREEAGCALANRFGHELTVQAIRRTLETTRLILTRHPARSLPTPAELIDQTGELIKQWLTPTLRSVINATGVILHTNLGRAPLSIAARDAMLAAAGSYNTLEYELGTGGRGSRSMHAAELLCRLTGAESALVVNNNASALLLLLATLARRRGVVISRTQLVEIGGGFRIPEVMAQSGAKLMEVGATNRVSLTDYETAIDGKPVAFLHAHHSNFKMIGFTSEPSVDELASLAHRHELVMIDDQGSGALLDTSQFGLGHEPTVQESLADGCDLVCFSGDKLLGGPQAGIILGKAELIARIGKHPLMRALRPDKLCLAALTATLQHYLMGEAESKIPVWQMISSSQANMKQKATAWQTALGQGQVFAGRSTIGGGSLPGETLPTSLLALESRKPDAFLASLRKMDPPLIARIEDDRVVLDPRTILDGQETVLLSHLRQALG
jgi:L-seryl-tRNA(Ser) seleniumtransferase